MFRELIGGATGGYHQPRTGAALTGAALTVLTVAPAGSDSLYDATVLLGICLGYFVQASVRTERSPHMDDLADFVPFRFQAEGAVRDVFRRGHGPPVIVIHEVPGISAEVARFGRKLVDTGFTVFMPHLFGVLGKRTNELSRVRELAKLCISREWHVLAENRSSPIADWLRALARHVNVETGGRGVGVIGMCVTGNFALTMTLDDAVIAPVLAHPSFPLPISSRKAAALHVTPQTLDNARRRAREEGLKVLGVRFTGDVLFCRSARFQTLKRELGDAFEAVEVPGKSAHPHPEPPHSVLTVGLIDREGEPTRAAVDRVIAFLGSRYRGQTRS